MPSLWAVFDLDGTLSNCEHRVHRALAKEWDVFHQGCGLDQPYPAEVAVAQAWVRSGGRVAYNTGRTEPYRTMTRLWMIKHQLPGGPLFMRGATDFRPSLQCKRVALMNLEAMLPKGDQIAFIMEDQDALVAMWRSLGYTCFQPRPGAF